MVISYAVADLYPKCLQATVIGIKIIGPGSNKRDLRGIKVKIKVFTRRQKERTGFD